MTGCWNYRPGFDLDSRPVLAGRRSTEGQQDAPEHTNTLPPGARGQYATAAMNVSVSPKPLAQAVSGFGATAVFEPP